LLEEDSPLILLSGQSYLVSLRDLLSSSAASGAAHSYLACAEQLFKTLGPGPRGALAAAIEIKGGDPRFGVGVAGQVRFGQQEKTCDAAGGRELVPHGLADYTKVEIRDYVFAHAAKDSRVGKQFRQTPFCVN
jgi:hypothetical protein